jgi:DNA-binding MarR family transcriptional regulator
LPATELARASLLTSGAMTTRIDHLETQALVERHRDPNDRRGVRVCLTARGREVIDAAIHARFMAAESSVCGLDSEERLAVEAGLRKLLLSLRPPKQPDRSAALRATSAL